MEEETLYEQFVHQMEKIGLIKEFSILEEKDVALSDSDEVIYVTIPACTNNNYSTISIKGIQEASIQGKIKTRPHHISMKAYGYDGEEAKPEDAVQFSITEFKKGLPTASEISSHVVYYHYPYRTVSEKLRLKKGIVITKDRRLEIKILRNSVPLKIAKLELKIECDKWYRKHDENKINLKKLSEKLIINDQK